MKQYLYVEDIKKIEIQMLDYFDAYCQKHNLRYYLAYGTLIGAMRHNGFIPWDDDIDAMMPRADYEKLLAMFNDDNKRTEYQIMAHSINRKYYLPFAKLVNQKTVLKEEADVDCEIGVYVDIFPLDNLSDSLSEARKIIKRQYLYNKQLQLKIMKWRKGRSLIKNLALIGSKIILSGKSISTLVEEIDSYCNKPDTDKFTKYVGITAGISRGDDSRIFEKEWFEKTIMVDFEGKQYPAPVGAANYLNTAYGDYLQLPPVEQRVSHHSFEAWVKEEE